MKKQRMKRGTSTGPQGNELAVYSPAGGADTTMSRPKPSKDDGPMHVLFDTKRPSHVGTGAVHAVTNVVKGVSLGVATLVAAPIIGAMQEGPKGFAKGVGVGAVAAVALPVAGVVTGVGQLGLGIVNTKAAVEQVGKGTVFNEDTQTWEPKYRRLSEEFADAKAGYEEYAQGKSMNSSNTSSPNAPANTVVDTEYYDVLQVAPNAKQAEIRKAYYKLARESHPDKVVCTTAEERAAVNERFQKIGEAYQVLSNETSRDQYDRFGKQATEHAEFVDHTLFFNLMFGSDALTPYVGNLALGSMMSDDGPDKVDFSPNVDRRESNFREVQIAMNLREMHAGAVAALRHGDIATYNKWKMEQKLKADSLCAESFGWQMVDAVGFSYENYANHFIAKKESFLQIGTAGSKLKKTHRQAGTLLTALKAVKSANDLNKKAMKVQKAQKNDSTCGHSAENTRRTQSSTGRSEVPLSAEEAELVNNALKHVLRVMLHLCIHDVLSTVRSACQKYLNDKSADETEQKLRAQVLQDLGIIFQAQAKIVKGMQADIDPREQMQDVYVKMAQKMDEQSGAV